MKRLSDFFKETTLHTFSDYLSLGRRIEQKIIVSELSVESTLNVALLTSSTVNGVKEVLVTQCSFFDVYVNVYVGEYGQYAQEILNPDSDLYASKPDLIIFNIDTKAIASDYFFIPYEQSEESRRSWVNETVVFLLGLVSQACKNTSAKVLLHNLEIPFYSPLGIMENKESYGYIESLEDVNRSLREKCKENSQVFIYDYNAFCSQLGKENLLDSKMYYMGDVKLKPQCIPALCADYAKYIQAIASRTKKCIVLDLDNTLWGGVVGESGIEGVQLGPTPEGRSFLEFQKYLYSLYARGVILAINSKNNVSDAMEVIQNHPHMILKEKCFAAMRINWDDKVANMKSLAKEINIDLDSFVFFDDDQVNREMVRNFLPDVTVIDLPKDPSLYVDTLKRLAFFDTLSLTKEDKNKGEMYQENKSRRELVQTATDLTDYLRMLNITVYLEEVNKNIIPRIAQLTQKTNQFNLTTRRYSEEAISKFSDDENFRIISMSLKDKFGDNGLTGLAIIEKVKNANNWRIDTFLLSCRVLGRRAEDVLLAYILSEAKKADIKYVTGEYIPSPKNMPTKEFYNKNGFININDINGIEVWQYNLENEYFFPEFINYKVL
jgi:FkbH-like protein